MERDHAENNCSYEKVLIRAIGLREKKKNSFAQQLANFERYRLKRQIS